MRIHFHGAAHGVTGSKHLLEINGQLILLDCGFFQGKREESYNLNKELPFDARRVNAMILSHAHIDHTGSIPTLVKSGYKGKIFCTPATQDVTKLMLMDSAHIQETDAEFFCKHEEIAVCIPRVAIYTKEDAMNALALLTPRSYHERFEVLPGIFCTFLDAGHILGSAVTVLDFEEHGQKKRLVFTGDVGRRGKTILRDPESPEFADYLITESTYGDRLHEPFTEMRAELERVVNETARKGGKIIIPSFALERTQELVYDLHVLSRENRIPKIPIYVDSPLATNVTKVFEDHPECFDDETRKDFLDDGLSPFANFPNLHYTESVDQSKALNQNNSPSIIISASGMCESGRIRHHLRNSVENPRNTILIVGFQAEYTLGRRIVERRPFLKILGEMLKLRANVEVLNGYSGHADANDLMNFIGKIEKISHVFIVHGEFSQSEGLAKRLRQTKRPWTIEIPERGDDLNPEEITYEKS